MEHKSMKNNNFNWEVRDGADLDSNQPPDLFDNHISQ